jgi:hypothetical protein
VTALHGIGLRRAHREGQKSPKEKSANPATGASSRPETRAKIA